MLFEAVAATAERVAAATARTEKSATLAGLLRDLDPGEVPVVVGWLIGEPRQGRLGVGWSTITKLDVAPADVPTLDIAQIDRWLSELAGLAGAGSNARRGGLLRSVFAAATAVEQRLLRRLFGGEMRQGALAGMMNAAVAKGSDVPIEAVRRAHMLSGDLGLAAAAAFTGGLGALSAVTLRPGIAVEPMLASPADGVADALALTASEDSTVPGSLVEWKLDGVRVQAHRRGGAVGLFTRNLNDVTARLPAVVEVVRRLPGGDLVLDGEVAGVDDAGRPHTFQDTMGDFGADGSTGRGGGLQAFFFDVLHAADAPMIDEPLAVRRTVLAELIPARFRLPSVVTADAGEAERFFDDAVAKGQEGVVVKALDAAYAAGRRGGSWRKVKPVHTFDLVVLAVEWGSGRRSGLLSNIHLGARSDTGFVMVGKTFKGMTDELLRWQTATFSRIAIAHDERVVHVRPEVVVEIAIDGVQRSNRYPGGVALRFARVKRYRPDLPASAATPIETLRARLPSSSPD